MAFLPEAAPTYRTALSLTSVKSSEEGCFRLASWFAAFSDVSRDIIFLFVIGLPALLAGTWLGLKLYGRLDDAGFRRAVLGLLLVSGLFLIAALR